MSQTHGISLATDQVLERYADWTRGEHEREWHVLRIVHAARPGLVPEPLATLIEHMSARETDWDSFLAGFDVDPVRLRSSRALVASQWLHMLLPGGVAAGRNPPETLDRQAYRLLGLLDG